MSASEAIEAAEARYRNCRGCMESKTPIYGGVQSSKVIIFSEKWFKVPVTK